MRETWPEHRYKLNFQAKLERTYEAGRGMPHQSIDRPGGIYLEVGGHGKEKIFQRRGSSLGEETFIVSNIFQTDNDDKLLFVMILVFYNSGETQPNRRPYKNMR